jgi:hypothetical protein
VIGSLALRDRGWFVRCVVPTWRLVDKSLGTSATSFHATGGTNRAWPLKLYVVASDRRLNAMSPLPAEVADL